MSALSGRIIAACILACTGIPPVLAQPSREISFNPFCAAVPRTAWLSQTEVKLRLSELGFTLVQLRMADDRCYAVVVKDNSGRSHDLIIHPVTAEIVKAAD